MRKFSTRKFNQIGVKKIGLIALHHSKLVKLTDSLGKMF